MRKSFDKKLMEGLKCYEKWSKTACFSHFLLFAESFKGLD